MHRQRYVVLYQAGGWLIKNANRRLNESYPSKAQALCAAIELAQTDGQRGHAPEVLVRHEDDRFVTEWISGKDPRLDEAARPPGTKQPGRAGA